jgi:hypothetical protein
VQSSEQSKQDILKVQIEQLFKETISVWQDSDTKKIDAVKRLAARMEELYISIGIPINTISSDITQRMQKAGVKTWAHVSDYLDLKYKRDYTPNYNLQNSIPDRGEYDTKNHIEEIIKVDPLARTKDQIQELDEYAKRIAAEAQANRQAAEVKHIALDYDKDHIPSKQYEKVTTDMPEPEKKLAYNAWNTFVMPQVRTLFHTAEGILSALEKLPPEDDQDQELAKAFELFGNMLKSLNEFMAPFKDLKYATTIKRWWRSVIRFYDHGKHAAAVMDAISSHKHVEDRDIEILKISCPKEGCPYFATVGDDVTNVQDPKAASQIKLLNDHIMDTHDRAIGKLPIEITKGKITVQVPRERDTTREQVGDRIKYLVELAINFVPNIKALEVLCNWREKTGDPRVAARRIDANPKLSDLA